ncbi:MAG: bifunctional diaminohydroxyphosphoribosylaminopyrimidine deaminase/5-amino-6-(5-phosphoribosylamino)uracil reductase RibD [Planctomycetota bacterium]
MTAELDQWFMRRAIEIARLGQGFVEPNPMVGSVVVKEGRILAEGHHAQFGGPHAEVNALNIAGEQAEGATLYVTLEPCCHHGKTPPCTDRVLASGVARVVVAMADPFPQVAGKGTRILRSAGLQVDVGCLEKESRALNAPYLKRVTSGRPYVHAKWAMTLDGRIATSAGESKWITGENARRHAHQFRGKVDAIVVGIGTAIADDPMLTARPAGPRVATRVVLDSSARLPLTSQLVQTAKKVPTVVVTSSTAAREQVEGLANHGCEIVSLPEDKGGRPSIPALLEAMGQRRWTNVLIEGGAGVLGAFLSAGEIDAVRVYVAPRVVGGEHALGPVGGPGIGKLTDALALDSLVQEYLSPDWFLTASRTDQC